MTDKIRRIAVATDLSERSDRAVRRAFQIARDHAAEVSVVSVVDDAYPSEIVSDMKPKIEELLEQITGEHDVKSKISVLSGDVIESISEWLSAGDFDLLVLGIHRPKAVLDSFRQTTMERLVRISNSPVLLVRDLHEGMYSKVLAPVSFSKSCAAVVKASLRLAPEAEYRLFHAWLVPFGGMTGGIDSDYAKQVRLEVEAAADDWRREHLPEVAMPQLVHGGVYETLAKAVRDFEPDLVAVGAHTRSGPALHRIGSFAAELIRHPVADVLISRGV